MMPLPSRLAQWAHLFQASGEKYALSPALLASICKRESFGGMFLKPQGSEGSGDWVTRKEKPERPIYSTSSRYVAHKLPDGELGYVPADGMGWGRGLMQIDYQSHGDWCAQKAPSGLFLWQVASENIDKGAEILAGNLETFSHALLPEMLADKSEFSAAVRACAVAAYNARTSSVLRVVMDLTTETTLDAVLYAVDGVTTGGDYVSSVLHFMKSFSTDKELLHG